MKIYLFNPDTGVYLGEDIVEDAPLENGVLLVPSGSTTIAPPDGGRGHVMIFEAVAQLWEVHSYLDQENSEAYPIRVKCAHQTGGKTVTSVKSALIGDDDPTIRTSIKNELKELGFDSICEASDGTSAMSMAFECLPDIAILDAVGGLNTACEIMQKLKTPVILLMSHCDPDTLNQIKKSGITTILGKPFRGQDLLPAIVMAIALSKEVELLNADVEELNKTIENQAVIYKAKKALMRSGGLSESEAFRKIQKLAMDKKKSMRQIAEAILLTE